MSTARPSDARRWVDPRALILVACVVYFVLRMLRFAAFRDGFDTVLLGNVLWRLSHGFDSLTALTGGFYVSTHGSPSLFGLMALFLGNPTVGFAALFALQAASLGLLVLAVDRLARHLGIARNARWVLVSALVLSPGAYLITQLDIHETTLGLGALGMAVTGSLVRDKTWRVLAWAGLASCFRIELAAAVVVAGVLLILFHRLRSGLGVLAVGAVVLSGYLAWLFLNPYTTGSVAAHFAHLGDTPAQALSTLLASPTKLLEPLGSAQLALSLVLWLIPGGVVISLRRPWWHLLALPTAGIAILGVWPDADLFVHHYWYTFLLTSGLGAVLSLATKPLSNFAMHAFFTAPLVISWVLFAPGALNLILLVPEAPDSKLQSDVRLVGESEGFVSVPVQMASQLVDREWLAPFPRPFDCNSAIGPYQAPSEPPEVIAFTPGMLDDMTVASAGNLRRLIAAYERDERAGVVSIFRIKDRNLAEQLYVPCSSETFEISPPNSPD